VKKKKKGGIWHQKRGEILGLHKGRTLSKRNGGVGLKFGPKPLEGKEEGDKVRSVGN